MNSVRDILPHGDPPPSRDLEAEIAQLRQGLMPRPRSLADLALDLATPCVALTFLALAALQMAWRRLARR